MFSEVLVSTLDGRVAPTDGKFRADSNEPLTKALSIKEKKFSSNYVLGKMAQEFQLKMAKNPIFRKIKIK